MNIINLTPHELSLVNETGYTIIIPASGQIARCAEDRRVLGSVAGLPVSIVEFGAVQGLPDPATDTIYIVSALVMARVDHRPDVFAPGAAVRDQAGKVIGASGLNATPAYSMELVQIRGADTN